MGRAVQYDLTGGGWSEAPLAKLKTAEHPGGLSIGSLAGDRAPPPAMGGLARGLDVITGWSLINFIGFDLTEGTAGWATLCQSADSQSAVSPDCIRQAVRSSGARPDGRNVMHVGNLRYSRVELCATRLAQGCRPCWRLFSKSGVSAYRAGIVTKSAGCYGSWDDDSELFLREFGHRERTHGGPTPSISPRSSREWFPPGRF